MPPELERHLDVWELGVLDRENALPDSGYVAQVEDIVEFGRRGEHALFHSLPGNSRQRNQARHEAYHFFTETGFTEISFADSACQQISIENLHKRFSAQITTYSNPDYTLTPI